MVGPETIPPAARWVTPVVWFDPPPPPVDAEVWPTEGPCIWALPPPPPPEPLPRAPRAPARASMATAAAVYSAIAAKLGQEPMARAMKYSAHFCAIDRKSTRLNSSHLGISYA